LRHETTTKTTRAAPRKGFRRQTSPTPTVSARDQAYVRRLFPALDELKSKPLRDQCVAFWTRLWRESGFERIEDVPWLARKRLDTGCTNVEHINQVIACVKALAGVATLCGVAIDRDQLIAGAIVFDADKIVLHDPPNFTDTDVTLLSQHTIYGASVALEVGLPMGIAHMILAHSKNSSVRPRTTEALLLHYADYIVIDLRCRRHGWDEMYAEVKPKWSRK